MITLSSMILQNCGKQAQWVFPFFIAEGRSLFLFYFSLFGTAAANKVGNRRRNRHMWTLNFTHEIEGTIDFRLFMGITIVVCK